MNLFSNLKFPIIKGGLKLLSAAAPESERGAEQSFAHHEPKQRGPVNLAEIFDSENKLSLLSASQASFNADEKNRVELLKQLVGKMTLTGRWPCRRSGTRYSEDELLAAEASSLRAMIVNL